MYVQEVGSGPRKLLVIPGWRLDSETEKPDWLPAIERRPGWRAVFVDLPGTGHSRGQHEGIRRQSDLLDRLLAVIDRQDADGTGWAVSGTSNGALLALGVLRRLPGRVRGIALRVPMLQADDDVRARDGQSAWEAAYAELPQKYRATHDHKVQTLWEPARLRTDGAFLEAIRADSDRYGLAEVTDHPIDFRGPALVVLGRQDARVGWREAWERLGHLPRATVAVLDGAGHALPAGSTQTTLWRALVDDWLERVEDEWPV